jgi:hypothetical protein
MFSFFIGLFQKPKPAPPSPEPPRPDPLPAGDRFHAAMCSQFSRAMSCRLAALRQAAQKFAAAAFCCDCCNEVDAPADASMSLTMAACACYQVARSWQIIGFVPDWLPGDVDLAMAAVRFGETSRVGRDLQPLRPIPEVKAAWDHLVAAAVRFAGVDVPPRRPAERSTP